MGRRLYVGNLSYDTTEDSLRTAFEAAGGSVSDILIMTDRETGRPRGFGFVEMANNGEAEAAIQALNGQELDDRALTVNESQPRERR